MKRFLICSVAWLFALPIFAQTTISNIDDSNAWYQPGTSNPNFCTGSACAGGSSNANLSWMSQGVTTQDLDGASQEFHVGGNQGGYGNARWWANFTPESNASTFNLDFHIYTDQNFHDVAQAIEFGVQQMLSNGNQHYTMQAQCDFAGGLWRFYNPQSGWVTSNRGCERFSPGWNHFTLQFQRTSCGAGVSSPTGQCVLWTNMVINGTNYPVTQSNGSGMYGPASVDGSGNQLLATVQLDGGASEYPYEMYMDEVSLSTNGTPDAGGGGGGGGGGPLPTPPANASAYTNLQVQANDPRSWGLCNASCAGAGPQSSGSSSLTFNHSSPSRSGSSMEMTSSGSDFWATMYYLNLGCPSIGCPAVKNMLEDMWFNPQSLTGMQQLEFDPDLYNAGFKYFGSVACRLKGDNPGHWYLWDSAGRFWDATPFTCTTSTIAPGTWHHLQLYVTFDTSSQQYTYQTFVFDGTTVFQNYSKTYAALNLQNTWTNVNIEQQIDNDEGTSTLAVYYDDYNLWVW